MLKITKVSEDDKRVTLRLEGKIINEWIEVLQNVCRSYKDKNNRTVILDFSDITFISDEGVKMLEDMKIEGVRVTNCSSFIRSISPSLMTDTTNMKKD